MPSNLPSSFASAAAGQNPRGASRPDGRGNASGEWSRSGRSTNGTLTFRRTSTTPSNQNAAQGPSEPPSAAHPDPAVISAMPVGSAAVDASHPPRYSRDELLNILSSQPQSAHPDVSALYMSGWNPGQANGAAGRGWGKNPDAHVAPQEPDICWDSSGNVKPVGLADMSPEERELFSSDINSPLKPQAQKQDGNHATAGLNGRKPSVSQGASVASPSSASRPGTRRRETVDTNPSFPSAGGLASPASATRPSREDSSWFGRRNADLKDSTAEEPDEDPGARDAPGKGLPFGSLMRTNTTGGVPGLGASSPWQSSPTTAGPPGGGAFGSFALPAGSAIGEKRSGNARGESRLAHLIPKDNAESAAGKPGDASSTAGPDLSRPWRARPRTDTDPFGEDSVSGSAVLGGAQDTSPPPMSHQTLRSQAFDTPVKGSTADFGMSSLNLGGNGEHDNEPLSPSETNPFRSPPDERGEHEGGSAEKGYNYGMPEHPASGFASLQRPFAQPGFDGSDRSQTSSVGAKAYPPLSNLTAWPSSATPDRERGGFPGFGGSLFGPMGDLQSPSLGNLSGVFGPATTGGLSGSGSISRGSKLGSLFPPAMQAQMQSQDNDGLSDSMPDLRQGNPLGAIGRNPMGDLARDTDSPLRTGRGVFDMFAPPDASRTPGSAEQLHGAIPNASQPQGFAPGVAGPFGAAPADPPSAQSRTMVMPDRMRWVYLDPQGNQQGPFTGLEMNDWYKAQFFTPNLRVKKLEDTEFEPLGQLIRRIGNSREPFLVPQIGIPHGPPSQGGPFSPGAGGVIQPPLVGAFPSFGRTLTAEEQNNLERRKQEEQFLMARQREFLSNQQSVARVQLQGGPGLNHHSSAHSLQSQPSFGSISSPITMGPQQGMNAIGSGGAFFDPQIGQQSTANAGSAPSLDMFREEDLARLTDTERQLLAGLQPSAGLGGASQQAQPGQQPIGMPSDASLRNHLPGTGDLSEDDEGFRERLQEFEQLRAQRDAEQEVGEQHQVGGEDDLVDQNRGHLEHGVGHLAEDQSEQEEESEDEEAAAQEAQLQYQQAQVAAAKASGLPMPFPPPQSSTPLPAPAPQRIKSNLPEQYATSSREGTPDMTPSSAAAQPPPLAPWAKDTAATETSKGPSLKEIQAAEAAKAAKAEEVAALARRALLEQEAAREREKEKAASIATGLPTSSTWGTASPVNASSSTSPWTKPATIKGPAPGAPTPSASDKKKTLADIQREEEARKQKAVREGSSQAAPVSASGKRYADLASKPNASPVPASGTNGNAAPVAPAAGWATVGAGGKVKGTTGPTQTRSTSATSVKPVGVPVGVSAAPSPRPVSKPTTTFATSGKNEAHDEFKKWVLNQLSRGNMVATDINEFAKSLEILPPMTDIISDAIYASSKTLDGRHFAEEYIRRKALADKGVVERQPTGSPPAGSSSKGSGGWNEVAKKTTHKETPGETNAIQGAGFKVVPSRKKGKK